MFKSYHRTTFCSTRENDDTNHGDMTNETNEDESDKSTDSTHIITANLKDLTITSPTSSSCTLSKLTHYACTQLTVHQIVHFLTKGYRRYICNECTVIPNYIQESFFKKKTEG